MAVKPLAFEFVLLTNAGVFSCHHSELVRTQGITRYNVVAIAAVGDWSYSLVNIVFLLNMSWDPYYDQHNGRLRKGLPMLGELHLEACRIG